MTTYYDDISEGYDKLHKEEQLKKIKIVRLNLKVLKNYNLLDIGCGTGFAFDFFECNLYGIDPSKKLLKKVKNVKNIKKASAEKIPFKDHFFDVIISITAIQNFDDVKKAISEIKRVSKTDSQIIISCLKKSAKLDIIKQQLKDSFKILKEIEESKDIIFVLKNKL